MFSKLRNPLWSVFVGGILALTLAGCGLNLFDQPPPQKSPDFKAGDKAECLAQVLPTMEHFVDGSASAPAVEQTWECFRVALNLYVSVVRGRDDDRYTARELVTFFETYYLKDIKINDRLLSQIMKLKQIIVGGTDLYLTRDELLQLIAASQELKIMSLKLLPYMKVFSFNWKLTPNQPVENDVHYFEDANLVLQDVAKDLAKMIAKNDRSYTISNVVILLDELSRLYGSQSTVAADLERVLPLVYKLKRTLAGGDEQSIAAHEWRRFILLGARGYVQFLRYNYFIKTNDQAGIGPEIVYIAKSIDDLFSYLGDMVAEKPNGVFTRAELLDVLQAITQFAPQVKVSDPFLLESMKLKRIFFGGNLDFFTPQDFIRARAKVDLFRSLTEKFLLYLPVYTYSWNAQLGSYLDNQKYFREAEANLTEVFRGFGTLIEDSYDLNDLQNFADEFEKLYPAAGKDFSLSAALKTYLPLIVAAKQVLVSDDQSVVTQTQWSPLMTFSGEALGRALYYFYFVSSPDSAHKVNLTHGEGLQSLTSFVVDSLRVVDLLIEQKPNAVIPYSDLAKMSSAAIKGNLLPLSLDQPALEGLFKVLVGKILLPPERRLAGIVPKGLSKESTAVARSEFGNWYAAQHFFETEVFQGVAPGGAVSGKDILKFLQTGNESNEMRTELRTIFESPKSMSFDAEGRLVVSRIDMPYDMPSSDRVNLARIASRLLMRTWSMDLARIKAYMGLSKDETIQFYADVKAVLVALEVVEPSNNRFGASRFLDANLFTPRANGDGYASFNELVDLVLDLLSGSKLSSMIKTRLLNPDPKIGCAVTNNAQSKRDQVNIGCLVELYARELKPIFSSLPDQRDYLAKLPRCRKISRFPWITDSDLRGKASAREKDQIREDDIDVYVRACSVSFDSVLVDMLKGVGYVADSTGMVNVSDITLVPNIMQYIEQLMQRFDRDHNGNFDRDEGMNSYPLFKKVLSDVSGYNDDKTLKGLLAWFMINGKPPESFWDKAYFYVVFRNQSGSWNIHTDRARITAILAYIAEAMASKNSAIIGDDPTGESKRVPTRP